MEEKRQFQTQPPNESLHWISYNLKALTKEVREICELLKNLKSQKEPIAKIPQPQPRNEEFPF